MKLQKPDLVHSPVSYCLQHASEVCYWGELSVDRSPTKPAVVQVLDCLVGVLLLLELDVNIADEMIPEVVADVHLLHGSIFVLTFDEDVFKEVVVMFLQRICICISSSVTLAR